MRAAAFGVPPCKFQPPDLRSSTARHRTPPLPGPVLGRVAVRAVPPVSATVGPLGESFAVAGRTLADTDQARWAARPIKQNQDIR